MISNKEYSKEYLEEHEGQYIGPFNFDRESNIDPVTQYALDVLDNKIVAGETLKLACQRHLDDLEKSKTEEFAYEFNFKLAEDGIIKFIEKYCKFTDGKLAGKPVRLEGFQVFILGSIFSWVDKVTGFRRFNQAYIQISRKNGKTLIVSWVALYMLMGDGYIGSQVYLTASAQDQARICYDDCLKTVHYSKALKKRLKITDSKSKIDYKKKLGKLRTLSSAVKRLDGFDPHCGVIDEYHAHPNNQAYKLLDDGAIQQDEPLIFIITTAGFNLDGPCYGEYKYCKQVLKGEKVNDKRFIYIAEMDKDDDILDPNAHKKCNPLIAFMPGGLQKIRNKVQEGLDKPDDLRNMLTKTLNKWVDMQKAGYLEVDKWDKLAMARLEFLDFIKGRECYVGADLSQKHDLSSVAFVFPLGNDMYAVFVMTFIPKERVKEKEKTDGVNYTEWIEKGWLTPCEGLTIRNKDIEKYVLKFREEYKLTILEVDFDTWGGNQFAQDLEEEGLKTVEIGQRVTVLSEPLKDFRNNVYDEKIIHDGNPVMSWMVRNSVESCDTKGNILLDKSKREKKIDGLAATINGYVRASTHEYNEKDVDVSEFASEEFLNKLWG